MYTHHTCAWYPKKPGDGVGYPGAGVFRAGITSGSSGRAASPLNCGALTPAPLAFLKLLELFPAQSKQS